MIERETDKYIDSIAKRVYPFTDKEKNCVNEFGKMIINRGHLKKEIIQVISKYDQSGEKKVLDSAGEQKEANS
jgi:hypothetical protein